jgi:hypothetical protein
MMNSGPKVNHSSLKEFDTKVSPETAIWRQFEWGDMRVGHETFLSDFDDIRIIYADLPVKVDLSANGDVEVGWIDWSSGGKLIDSNIERRFLNESYFDGDYTIRLIGVDTPDWAKVNNSVPLHDLLEDGFKNDGSFDMQIKNLIAGEYIITTYHHDSQEDVENDDDTINITVSDADGNRVVADHLKQSW